MNVMQKRQYWILHAGDSGASAKKRVGTKGGSFNIAQRVFMWLVQSYTSSRTKNISIVDKMAKMARFGAVCIKNVPHSIGTIACDVRAVRVACDTRKVIRWLRNALWMTCNRRDHGRECLG